MLQKLPNLFASALRINQSLVAATPEDKPQSPVSLAAARKEIQSGLPQGVQVSLSPASLMKAKDSKNDDIDQAGLPDALKQLLKRMRELKQQIAEKQKELQAAMAEPGLSDEERVRKVQALQQELTALTGALMDLQAAFRKQLETADLTDEQVSQALALSY